jgi:cytochrome c peroxidase
MRDYLDRPNLGLDSDLDALAAYVTSLAPKKAPPPAPELSEFISRGQSLFFSEETGCSVCHPPPRYTDSGRRNADGELIFHDVGTWRPDEDQELHQLDTPSLLDLRRSEPYLHDGRAATLEQVFVQHNPEDRHGRTSHLGADDIRALVEFLRHVELGTEP